MKDLNIYKNIYDSAKKFLVPLETKEVYQTIVSEAISLVGGKDGSIFSFEDGKAKRIFTTCKDLYDVAPRKEGITYQVYETGLPYLRHKKELVEASKNFNALPYDSDVTVPLNYGHITIGVLSILSKQGKKFSEQDIEILNIFGPLATLALRKTQLHQEAKKSVRTRDLFISMAAHELKNPLTLIKLNAQLLLKSKSIKDTPQLKRVESILKGTERLDSLTNELLQVDRIRTGKLQYKMEKINIVELVKQVVRDSRQRYQEYKLVFVNKSGKEKVFVEGDTEKLEQVFINIINNAVKFSAKSTTINATLDIVNKNVVVKISDQGVGIPEDVIPQLFTKFYRGESSKEGMGLGLYLVKQIITKHHGEIAISSEVDKGTSVSIKLPTLIKNGTRVRSRS